MSDVATLRENNDVGALIECVRSGTWATWRGDPAEDALVEIGVLAVGPMMEALQELRGRVEPTVVQGTDDWRFATGLIRALGRIGDRRAVPTVVAWNPIQDKSSEWKRELVKDRRRYLKDPGAYEDPSRGVVTLWLNVSPLTRVWVDALINLGGPEAEASLGGAWSLP